MTRRFLSSRLAALAAMAVLASSGETASKNAKKIERRRPDYDEEPIFMNANPRHDYNRGKRGGNGKGRKWWNS